MRERFDTALLRVVNAHSTYGGVVSCVDAAGNVSWILFSEGTELGTQVKTGSRAGRTHSQ